MKVLSIKTVNMSDNWDISIMEVEYPNKTTATFVNEIKNNKIITGYQYAYGSKRAYIKEP